MTEAFVAAKPPHEQRVGFWKIVAEDLRVHREGILAQGFWALFVYRIFSRRHAIRITPLRRTIGVLSLLAQKYIEVVAGIALPDRTTVGRRLNIEHFGGIIIHGAVVIGDDCMIRQGVTIGNKSEEAPLEAPTIGDRVVIGAGAKVLGNIEIGDDAVIGANAVVVRSVPAGHMALGVPARIIPRK